MGLGHTPPDPRHLGRTVTRTPGWYPGIAIQSPGKPRRRVLIVEETPSDSNILHALLNVLNCESELALSARQALFMMRREEFDAILLDLRQAKATAKTFISQVQNVRPDMVSRVLVISGEVEETSVQGPAGHRSMPCATDIRLMENVHRRLVALWNPTRQS